VLDIKDVVVRTMLLARERDWEKGPEGNDARLNVLVFDSEDVIGTRELVLLKTAVSIG
jgi:hypothetical protein